MFEEFEKSFCTRLQDLLTIHAEIGTPLEKIEQERSDLFNSILQLTDNLIQTRSNERDDLAALAIELRNRISKAKRLMGEYVADNTTKLPNQTLDDYVAGLCLEESIVKKHYEKRLTDVKELYSQLNSYAKSLGDCVNTEMMTEDSIDVSLPAVTALEEEIRRSEDEFTRRTQRVDHLVHNIVSLWTTLGLTPFSDQDHLIDQLNRLVRIDDKIPLYNQLVGDSGLQSITQLFRKLEDTRQECEFRRQEIVQSLHQMWDRLRIDHQTRNQLLQNCQGLTTRDIQMLEEEQSRLKRLKEERVGDFINATREELACLWDQLYMSDNERRMFGPAFTDIHDENALEAHENEVARLQLLVEDRKHILEKVEQHMNILQEIKDFENTTNDPSRLFGKGQRDPGRLLREEKFRKRVHRELPKIERELKGALNEFETTTKKTFNVYGESYLKVLESRDKRNTEMRSDDNDPKTPRRTNEEAFYRQQIISPIRQSPTTRSIFRTPQPTRTQAITASPRRQLRRQLSAQPQSNSGDSILHRVRENNIKQQHRHQHHHQDPPQQQQQQQQQQQDQDQDQELELELEQELELEPELEQKQTQQEQQKSLVQRQRQQLQQAKQKKQHQIGQQQNIKISNKRKRSNNDIMLSSGNSQEMSELDINSKEESTSSFELERPIRKLRKRIQRQNLAPPLDESKPCSDEDFSLDTGIFDDGPELSDMSDHDSL
ncbi:microtubule associated protein-domain-containing protein [Phycomyces blakesleeanus]|uniref:Microtubule associated protein-domain-containing protein n=1 Tax=Phycomyces blakesleeanus TaxID=4837 RepID=A0ABR3BGG5_PHYBL